MKRVWNLYRVSTDRQHDGDDIPLQRKACTDFINTKPDWKLSNEVYEMGVSGYKLSSKDRDEIEFLLKAAENKEFDVLLVFMFDRIGRRDDDTPILVQTFCKLGVEVWSVKEGERRFDNHIDKLMNYITFWQASGESDKTSKRVTERISQINEEGGFTGGVAPYGYEVYDTGVQHNKYDKTIKDLRISPKESELVRLIFNLAIEKGFGAPRITQYLNEEGYKTRKGTNWRHNYISRILRNHIYIGYKQYGYNDKENKIDMEKLKLQPFNPNYVILDQQRFELAQQIIDKRREGVESTNTYINAPTKSEFLLSGIVKCGYCDHNLKVDYSIKSYVRKTDGETTKMKTLRYTCGHGKDKTVPHGATQFGAKKYEEEVVKIVKERLRNVNASKYAQGKKNSYQKATTLKGIALQDNQKLLDEALSEQKAIESLIIKIEMGKSRVPIEQAENMLLEQNRKIDELKSTVLSIQSALDEDKERNNVYEYVEQEIVDWDTKFDNADFDEKKMMLSRVVTWIKFKKDEIELELIEPLSVVNE